MEVGISALRGDLSTWIAKVKAGEEVVVTDRGTPVLRLVPIDSAPLLQQLVERGVISRPTSHRRPAARSARRVRATGPVADLVTDLRR